MAAQTQDQSLIHRELQRKSQDTHHVNYPETITLFEEEIDLTSIGLEQDGSLFYPNGDFKLVWDGYVDRIQMGVGADLTTFKTDRYIERMTKAILTRLQDIHVKKENDNRIETGKKPMDKFDGGGEQPIMEAKFSFEKGLGNPDAIMQIYEQLYGGLVREYGVERLERDTVEHTPTTHEQLMDKILNSRGSESDSKTPVPPIMSKDTPQTPLEKLTQPQLRKVAKEKGLDTEKTDKKAELIERISQA